MQATRVMSDLQWKQGGRGCECYEIYGRTGAEFYYLTAIF